MKRHSEELKIEITAAKMMDKYRRWKERTSTSPSGRHLGHFHALFRPLKAKDDDDRDRLEGIRTEISLIYGMSLSTAISSHMCPNGKFYFVTGFLVFFVALVLSSSFPSTVISVVSVLSMLSSPIPLFIVSSSSSLSSKYRSSSSLSPPPLILSPCISSFFLSFVFSFAILFCVSFLLILIGSFLRLVIGSIK
jgi:hypothetical protein